MAVFADPFGSYLDGFRQGETDARKSGKGGGGGGGGGDTSPKDVRKPDGSMIGPTPHYGVDDRLSPNSKLPAMTGDGKRVPEVLTPVGPPISQGAPVGPGGRVPEVLAPVVGGDERLTSTGAPAATPFDKPGGGRVAESTVPLAASPFDDPNALTPAFSHPPAVPRAGAATQSLEGYLAGLPPPPPLPNPMGTFPPAAPHPYANYYDPTGTAPPMAFDRSGAARAGRPPAVPYAAPQGVLDQNDRRAFWTPYGESRAGALPPAINPGAFDAYREFYRPRGEFERNPFRPRDGVMIP